jgi:hypothetical protein
MGRALPLPLTNWPTSVCVPEWLTSSHEGTCFPSMSTVISHRPSMVAVSAFSLKELLALATSLPEINKAAAINACLQIRYMFKPGNFFIWNAFIAIGFQFSY